MLPRSRETRSLRSRSGDDARVGVPGAPGSSTRARAALRRSRPGSRSRPSFTDGDALADRVAARLALGAVGQRLRGIAEHAIRLRRTSSCTTRSRSRPCSRNTRLTVRAVGAVAAVEKAEEACVRHPDRAALRRAERVAADPLPTAQRLELPGHANVLAPASVSVSASDGVDVSVVMTGGCESTAVVVLPASISATPLPFNPSSDGKRHADDRVPSVMASTKARVMRAPEHRRAARKAAPTRRNVHQSWIGSGCSVTLGSQEGR